MKSTPIVLDSPDDVGRRLVRVEVQPNDARNEAWLQELLYSHPRLLPVDEFDDRYSPAIPVGREVRSGRGPIDLLFVSPEGEVIVAETKLWKNPEQHRVVVSQLLDYAKQMVAWDYNQLNEAVIQAARARGELQSISLDDKVKPHLSEAGIALHVFQERIQENLRGGKFLLLVVGDRIAPNVALLTNTIHAAPGLGFTIRLVEMRMYQVSAAADWPLFVVPTIIGRTVEKPRTVVEVRYCDKGPSVNVVNDEDDGVSRPTNKLDLDAFISSVPADLAQSYRKAIEQWENVGGTVRFADKRMFFVYERDGTFQKIVRCDRNKISVVRHQDVEQWGGNGSAFESYASTLESAPSALDFARSDKLWVPYSKLTPHDVQMIFAAALSLVQQLKSEE